MSAFQRLKNASNKFEEELRRVSTELFSAKTQESFEDVIAKKLRNTSLFTSKLRLLQAKQLSLIPQVTEHNKDEETVLSEYGELVTRRIVEHKVIKSITQAHSVKSLVTMLDSSLSPELVIRKEQITKYLSEYRDKEYTLQCLDKHLKSKEDELACIRATWDKELGELKEVRTSSNHMEVMKSSEPIYLKIQTLIRKLDLIRWLVGKLVMPRTRGYDWLADPHGRIHALRSARRVHTVDTFLEPTS